MKLLIVWVILAVATCCYAGQGWKYVDKLAFSNCTLEINEASIESINSTTVRALTRLVRTNPNIKEWTFGPTIESTETIADYDCAKLRYKILDITDITVSGARFPLKVVSSVPTFVDIPNPSMLIAARDLACKSEGKLK